MTSLRRKHVETYESRNSFSSEARRKSVTRETETPPHKNRLIIFSFLLVRQKRVRRLGTHTRKRRHERRRLLPHPLPRRPSKGMLLCFIAVY